MTREAVSTASSRNISTAISTAGTRLKPNTKVTASPTASRVIESSKPAIVVSMPASAAPKAVPSERTEGREAAVSPSSPGSARAMVRVIRWTLWMPTPKPMRKADTVNSTSPGAVVVAVIRARPRTTITGPVQSARRSRGPVQPLTMKVPTVQPTESTMPMKLT